MLSRRFDGRPADFKSVKSYKKIVTRAKEATRDQGAVWVLFEFQFGKSTEVELELLKVRRMGIKFKYYYKGENIVHE